MTRSHFFHANLRNYARTVGLRTTKFGKITYVGRVSLGHPRRTSQVGGSPALPRVGDSPYLSLHPLMQNYQIRRSIAHMWRDVF